VRREQTGRGGREPSIKTMTKTDRGIEPDAKLSEDKSVLNAVADGDHGTYESLAMYIYQAWWVIHKFA
jgi:hypothetical protein